MNRIKTIIEQASDGSYAIRSEEVDGAFGFGLTEQEAREEFLEVLEELADYYKERRGEYPAWYKESLT
ncbi:hypothetical protein LJC35_04050 [Parabacteroides sp. OttesenSCG-928-N08]|nr:hypothetical protein [Parabacteroides sp. OttesenSCG-928-N08]